MRWMFVYHDLYLTRLTELFAWRNGHSSVTERRVVEQRKWTMALEQQDWMTLV